MGWKKTATTNSHVKKNNTKKSKYKEKEGHSEEDMSDSDDKEQDAHHSDEDSDEDSASQEEEASLSPPKSKKQKVIKHEEEDYDVEKILECKIIEGSVYFLVKLKDRSYRATKWIARDEFEAKFSRKKRMILSFLEKEEEKEATGVNPDATVIEKVLDQTYRGETKYLIKWKSLGYDECTWELEDSLTSKEDKAKIVEFKSVSAALQKLSGKSPPKLKPPKRVDIPSFKDPSLSLKPYQVEGFTWLVVSFYQQRNCILADGKTREFTKWTSMRVVPFYGDQHARNIVMQHDWFATDSKGKDIKNVYKFHVLLTTYEMVIAESKTLKSVNWSCLVLDEGHRIKNTNSKTLERLKSLSADFKVVMTGTPLQNSTKELWALLNFLDPDKFNSCEKFLDQFGDLKQSEQVEELQKLVGPFMLRRLKKDVETSIPSKEETIIEVELTAFQKAYYRAILEKNRDFLTQGVTARANVPKLTNIMMQIRKVCNHPFLISGAEEYMTSKYEGTEDHLVRSSAKLILLDKLLPRLRQEGHKVLIFSQMVRMLDILEDYFDLRGFSFERIDGSITGKERQQSVDRFVGEKESFIFLSTTKAGGLGINLQVSDTVIIFDSDFNPQNDIQAQARAHRIGQTSNVKVYRLITHNTYERYMLEVASKKLALDHAVLGSVTTDKSGEEIPEMDKEHIDALLKYGAYKLFQDTDDEEHEKAMLVEDIDTILKRASTVKYEEDDKLAALNFSKARWVSNEDENNAPIDLYDVDFWEKVLPHDVTLKQLQTRITNLTALATPETRDQFLTDLQTLIQKTKRTEEIWYAGSDEKADMPIIDLCCRIEQSPLFTAQEKERAKELRLTVERPRFRERKARIPNMSRDSKGGTTEDTQDNPYLPPHVSYTESMLLDVSRDLWESVPMGQFSFLDLIDLQVPSTLEAGQSYVLPFKLAGEPPITNFHILATIHFTSENASKVYDVRVYKILDIQAGSVTIVVPGFAGVYSFRPFFAPSTSLKSSFCGLEKRTIVKQHPALQVEVRKPQVNVWLTKLLVMRDLRIIVETKGWDQIQIPFMKSKPPADWWTSAHDVILLQEAFIKGYGAYSTIFQVDGQPRHVTTGNLNTRLKKLVTGLCAEEYGHFQEKMRLRMAPVPPQVNTEVPDPADLQLKVIVFESDTSREEVTIKIKRYSKFEKLVKFLNNKFDKTEKEGKWQLSFNRTDIDPENPPFSYNIYRYCS